MRTSCKHFKGYDQERCDADVHWTSCDRYCKSFESVSKLRKNCLYYRHGTDYCSANYKMSVCCANKLCRSYSKVKPESFLEKTARLAEEAKQSQIKLAKSILKKLGAEQERVEVFPKFTDGVTVVFCAGMYYVTNSIKKKRGAANDLRTALVAAEALDE